MPRGETPPAASVLGNRNISSPLAYVSMNILRSMHLSHRYSKSKKWCSMGSRPVRCSKRVRFPCARSNYCSSPCSYQVHRSTETAAASVKLQQLARLCHRCFGSAYRARSRSEGDAACGICGCCGCCNPRCTVSQNTTLRY